MNITSVKTMNYEQITMNNEPKNKPNQSQFKLEAQRRSLWVSFLGIFKPGTNRTYFKIGKIQQLAKLLVYWYNSIVVKSNPARANAK